MPEPLLAGATLALGVLLSTTPTRQDSAASPDAPALFKMHCAPCHGETGDGKGWTELDRPARSFKDGGFSYGNTPEALFRSISTGIPGTPMPGFATALGDKELRALAAHVVGLGPEQGIEDSPKKVLVVRDRPVIVRGGLPAIVDGAKPQPRGLLVGTPSGMTFEYRIDDVRLLGVRQGEFVERQDWTGRGGDPLKPLGKLVYAVEDGNPGPTFVLGGGALKARIVGTRREAGRATLRYELHDELPRATVEEWLEPTVTSVGTGWTRHLRVESSSSETIRFTAGRHAQPEHLASFTTGRADDEVEWSVWKQEELYLVESSAPTFPAEAGSNGSVTTLLLPDWSDEIRAKLEEELAR